ncbi:MAG: DNA photolyase family protein [Actinobacteria bacterium]|nr:DNA photolyase family protein [Actinomycetota bacterium]MCG2799482.1 DNA photolyase family protein [Cellulomonas sp.]
MPSVLWLRRDLRLHDNPALLAAAAGAGDDEVVVLVVADRRLWAMDAAPRLTYLQQSWRALDEALGGRLVVRVGDPATVVPALVREVQAPAVHVSAATEPYGRRRDAAVAGALGGVPLVATGSPYAVGPGLLRTGGGTPYRVFTPFLRTWLAHGWPAPAPTARTARWARLTSDPFPEPPAVDVRLPRAGEDAARARWSAFVGDRLTRYDQDRDRVDLDGTSRLSAALRFGELHPRTLLSDLQDDTPANTRFISQLAWREFHADVLWHQPRAAYHSLHLQAPEDSWAQGDEEAERLAAWCAGRTGYPFVDAGMRQLLAEGWLPGRVRMVVASFLVKDLHVRWQRGAAWFMSRLVDGEVANNQLSWQWVAGTGLDAAQYVRVFNPVTQGLRFDPQGAYVRRWVPELGHVPGPGVHRPWLLDPPAPGYPPPLVDHATERLVTLEGARRLR